MIFGQVYYSDFSDFW